ncbi:hypothetical protein C4B68_34000 [Streptomyces dengpaensis]|uniref:DUF3040 domain-containing protein n=1 Tax=Streptomyces dengpaensis TaxID=2049881 RepID=A0ABM6SZ56_9ACTN|nr:hypothetical protein C4B68_34000 [Streptomyces dengpaensis]PIB09602.1 hypothetical protein B1C81_10675 [Streptomyces sp. HG99]
MENLAHYWKSLPAESPLRLRYAPPDEVDARYWVALLAVAAGIAFMTSGGILLGLLVAVGGLVYGAVMHAGVERYQAALADWQRAQICLACTGRF